MNSSRGRQERVGNRDGEALAIDFDDDLVTGVGRFPGADCAGVFGNGVIELGLNPARVDRERFVTRGSKSRVVNDQLVEREHRRKPDHLELAQCAARFRQGVFSIGPRDNQFCEQRVERPRDYIACDDPRINPNTRTARKS